MYIISELGGGLELVERLVIFVCLSTSGVHCINVGIIFLYHVTTLCERESDGSLAQTRVTNTQTIVAPDKKKINRVEFRS